MIPTQRSESGVVVTRIWIFIDIYIIRAVENGTWASPKANRINDLKFSSNFPKMPFFTKSMKINIHAYLQGILFQNAHSTRAAGLASGSPAELASFSSLRPLFAASPRTR